MTDFLGMLAYLVLPLIGIGVCYFPFVRRQPLTVRLALAMATGALVVTVTMSVLSVIGVKWSRTVLFPIAALYVIGGIVAIRRTPTGAGILPPSETRSGWPRPFAIIGIAVPFLLTAYGTITARESCGDLQFTWGTKAIRWFRSGGIDPGVLHTWPQLTVDYPPLHTLLLAWSNMFTHQFSWWAAILVAPLFFLATLAVFRAWTGDDLSTVLMAMTLAYTFTLAYPAGCAEPPLLLFETIVICALTFIEDRRAQTFFVALGLAGTVFTKLEGTTFAIATVLTIVIVQRNWRRAMIVAIPAAILIGAWMAFVFRNDLLYMYGGARLPIYLSALPAALRTLAKVAKFELYWLPWIVPIVLIAFGNVRRALVPISIAVLTWCATIFFYIHYTDPVWWIESSSPRVILTPLLALLIGAAAAHAPLPGHGRVPPDGVVP